MRRVNSAILLTLLATAVLRCGGDDDSGRPPSGKGGKGGSAGKSASAGKGGSAGSKAGSGGTSTTAGKGGSGGSGGTGANAGTGASAGTGGSGVAGTGTGGSGVAGTGTGGSGVAGTATGGNGTAGTGAGGIGTGGTSEPAGGQGGELAGAGGEGGSEGGEGPGAAGSSGLSGAGGQAPDATPTFAELRAVFDSRCGTCHNGVGNAATRVKLTDIAAAAAGSGGAGNSAGSGGAGTTAGGAGTSTAGGGVGGASSAPTPLDDATLYLSLTTALPEGTATCGGEVLVVPGDLATSFLITKLTSDSPGCGNRMPAGCSSTPSKCLTPDQLDTIQNWISGGAPHGFARYARGARPRGLSAYVSPQTHSPASDARAPPARRQRKARARADGAARFGARRS
jgi:hypothetical protein